MAECAVFAALARDDIPKTLEAIGAFDRLGPRFTEVAGYRKVVALERSGRLEEARRALAGAERQPEKIGWLIGRLWTAEDEAWLEMRRTGKSPPLPPWVAEYASSDLLRLRELARFSAEVGLAEPLAQVIERHAAIQKGSKSRFVTEQIAFARGCLALARGEPERTRATLEPLARTTEVPGYHHVLGRAYEALGMWRAAAAEYEDVLERFYFYRMKAAIWTLDKFRLAQIYERLGDSMRARQWYERFLADWKDADPDIPELKQARERLIVLSKDASGR